MSKNRLLFAMSWVAVVILAFPFAADARSKLGVRVAQAEEPKDPAKAADASKKAKDAKKAKDEPSAKSSDEPSAKGSDEPSAKGGDEPSAKSSDEPSGKSSEEPSAKGEPRAKAAGEPGAKAAGEPTPTTPGPVAAAPATKFGVGLHIRASFIHPWLLGLFFDESTPLNSMAFGGEFIYRRGTFDIIGSIDFGFYSPKDGNYLENNKNPANEVDYIQFDGLNVLAFGVLFVKHHEILPWMSFIWGGGVGLGIVLGNIYRVSAGQGCDSETAGDESRCRVIGMDPNNPDPWLNDPQHQGTEDQDSPNSPRRWKETGVPPVVPVVHLLVGLDFKISDQFGVRVDGGFRNAFYFGATGNYFF